MTRTDLLNKLIQGNGYLTYLEIGVRDGANFRRIQAEDKTGVDPAGGEYVTHQMTSDDFFHDNERIYDLIFIDGLHHADQVERDIRNAVHCLAEDGAIVLHDCNPHSRAAQEVPRRQSLWNGDVWRAWVRYIHERDTTGFTIATDYGLGVLHYRAPECQSMTIPETLDYDWLEEHRGPALRLISIEAGLRRLNLTP